MVAAAAAAVAAAAAAAAAASTIMDKIHSTLKIKEVKDIFKEEWVEMLRVVSEGEVVYVEATMELEVILEEIVELMNSSPVGEGVDLLTMGQISKINVVLIAMNMVE